MADIQPRGKVAKDYVVGSAEEVMQNVSIGTWWEQRRAAVEGIGNLIWESREKQLKCFLDSETSWCFAFRFVPQLIGS
jgi:hypothetical protein